MSFWGSFLNVARRVVQAVVAKHVTDAIRNLPKVVRNWWYGKKISVIGPTGAGKNSFYNRLRNTPVPDEHIQTRGVEEVDSFDFVQLLPNGEQFKLQCKRSVNVGGEVDERDRYWAQACRGADVVFYVIDAQKVLAGDSAIPNRERVTNDLKWLAVQMAALPAGSVVHILVNKIDLFSTDDNRLKEYVQTLERTVAQVFGPYRRRVTGVTPISMIDGHLFTTCFAGALDEIYKAQRAWV